MADDGTIGLPDAICSLREELSEAIKAGTDAGLRFKVEGIDLELSVEVTREAGAGGGVKFWVASFEGKSMTARTAGHRVKLTLSPVTREGGDVEVASQVPGRPA